MVRDEVVTNQMYQIPINESLRVGSHCDVHFPSICLQRMANYMADCSLKEVWLRGIMFEG